MMRKKKQKRPRLHERLGITPTDLNYLMKKSGITQTDIAARLDKTPSMVNKVVNGVAVAADIEAEIIGSLPTDAKDIIPGIMLKAG